MAKGRPENFKPLSTEEARERGKNGGKRSVQVRQEKKTLRETMEAALQAVNDEGLTTMQAGVKATVERWIKTGDIAMLNGIMNLLGENPKNVVELESNDLTGIKVKFVDKSKRNTGKEQDPKIIGDYTPPSHTED